MRFFRYDSHKHNITIGLKTPTQLKGIDDDIREWVEPTSNRKAHKQQLRIYTIICEVNFSNGVLTLKVKVVNLVYTLNE